MTARQSTFRPGEARIDRVPFALFLAALALLPWSRVPAFPWIHAHAQWSDAFVVLALLLMVVGGGWRSFRAEWPVAAAVAVYALAQQLSALLSHSPLVDSRKPVGVLLPGACALLARATSMAPGGVSAMARVVVVASVSSAFAAVGLAAMVAVVVVAVRRPGLDRAMLVTLIALGVDGLAQDVEDFRHVWVALGVASLHALPISNAKSTALRSAA